MAAKYFTSAQIEEIKQRLALLGSKDSQLPVYAKPLSGDEIFAIVQNGANKQIPLNDVMKMVSSYMIEVKTTEEWQQEPDYVPEQGQIIVYSDYNHYTDEYGDEIIAPAIKIGDGEVPVGDLPFVGDNATTQIFNHIENISIHVSSNDREWWEKHMDVEYDSSNEKMVLYYTDRENNRYTDRNYY